MRRAALFICHASRPLNVAVCLNHINVLRRFNPNVPIHILHGGFTSRSEQLMQWVTRRTAVSYSRLPHMPLVHTWPYWRMHLDLAVRHWYATTGYRHPFEVLNVVEWDFVALAPLDKLFGHVPATAAGLTWLEPLSVLMKRRWDWIAKPPHAADWAVLEQEVRTRFGYRGVAFGCGFPGTQLPRSFLDAYAAAEVPAVACCEARLPLMIRALGFKHCDNRLGVHGQDFDPVFNCAELPVQRSTIQRELSSRYGRRAFHPVLASIRRAEVERAVQLHHPFFFWD